MSLFSGLNKLKDALDEVVHENQSVIPAGHTKTQEEVRSEIQEEEGKVHDIQKKTGWSDRVSSFSSTQPLNIGPQQLTTSIVRT